MEFSKKALVRNAPIARRPINPPGISDADAPPKERRGKHSISVLRINPFNRTIARMPIEMSTEPASGAATIAKLCRTNQLGSHDLQLKFFGFDLIAAGGMEHLPETPRWMIKGQALKDDTRGIGILFVRGPTGGMASLPHQISMGWARENVVWIDGKPDEED